MDGPVILCGFGRLGQRVLECLRAADVPVVVIDDRVKGDNPRLAGVRVIPGDFRDQTVLVAAGVLNSRGVLILTSNSQQRLEELPNRTGETDDDWDKEYERKSFVWAAERVRHEFQPTTWNAFWKTAVEGASPKDVGRELGMSPGAVYVAKSRVIARLRDEISQLNPE